MSGKSASLYFYRLYLLSFSDYLSARPLRVSCFEKFWENVNITWVLENIFWNTCWKLWGNFENIFEIFKNYFVELFRIFSRNLVKPSKKFRKSKFSINSGKIMENYRGNLKLLILRKLRRMLKMFLSRFSEIAKKFWRKAGNTL